MNISPDSGVLQIINILLGIISRGLNRNTLNAHAKIDCACAGNMHPSEYFVWAQTKIPPPFFLECCMLEHFQERKKNKENVNGCCKGAGTLI